MNGNKGIITFLFLWIFAGNALLLSAQENYPVPAKTNNMLFYLQRSFNRNTIIYALNKLPDGSVNSKNPIIVYWIRYQERGQKAELSYLQGKVFGVKCEVSDQSDGSFILNFNYFDKRDIFLSRSVTGDYKAFVTINHELVELTSAFIQSESSSSGMPQSFKFLEFHGTSVISGKKVSEKILL
jgi:hypothetical protein